MPITDEQEEKLMSMLSVISENRKQLNSWEQTFFDDQEKRFAEHGAKINLSPKQWAVLDKMYEKVTEV